MPTSPRATRAAALTALDDFLPRVVAYAARRSFVQEGYHEVSCLSPYIRRRLISEREVVSAVLSRYSFSIAEKFIQEVVWRTYWKGWLERHPWVWSACLVREANILAQQQNASWGETYERACRGETQLPFFNEWRSELLETGYLHNHVRMWFASVWIFTLRIPWQLGAMFMYRHLLDGDPASNTLSWRWVAGLQTRGKSYLAQADNIAKYSEGRWIPKAGDLAQSVSLIEDDGAGVPRVVAQREYHPLPDGVFGVITTNEDLSVEQISGLVHNDTNVALLTDRTDRGVSSKVADFICQAESDLMVRLGERGSVVVNPHSVVEWATSRRLSQVVIVAPMVGFNSALADDASRALIDNGVSVVWYQREWDRQLHRLADKGFFPFWERVKKMLI